MSTEERTSAIGLARYAREYYDSAIAADRVVGLKPGYEIHAPAPVMFLVAHSIELALKSYLVYQGSSLKELVALGHDLTTCLEKAQEKGLQHYVDVQLSDMNILKILNKLHVSTELRYIRTGYKEFPVFGPLQETAKKILDGVCPLVGYR